MHDLPRRYFSLALVLVLGFCVSGCYYMQAARGQLEVLNKREPIDDVIAAAGTPVAVAESLALVKEARRFAVDELHLPDNESYLNYADLGRDYVVWNVFAAPEFSLVAKEWCYPIAGCVSYRGYFSEDAANRKAEALRHDGYDVAVAGIPAYSTLGRFDDPVLNTMMHGDNADLIATIFHELAHQVLYVKNDTQFNESFATTVEQIGIERWLLNRDSNDELTGYRERREVRRRIIAIIAATRVDLETLYMSSMAPHEMRAGKRRRFEQMHRDIVAVRETNGMTAPSWSAGDLNNAYLLTARLYHGRVDEFTALFKACEEDFRCFYERAADLAD